MVMKKPVVKMLQRAAKPVPVATCSHCGANVYDGQPMVCCVPGTLGYLECVLAKMADSLQPAK